MLAQYIQQGKCFILVYAINAMKSYLAIDELHRLIGNVKEAVVPVIVLGNKCDLDDERQVKEEDRLNMEHQLQCQVIETSAKTNLNIDKAFEELVKEAMKIYPELNEEQKEGRRGRACIIV